MSSGTTSNKPTFNRQLLKEKNKRLNAFIHIFKEPRASGSGPLHGLTYAAKDNFCTQGIPTTAGSKILEGWTPPYESTVTQRLHDAGAALVGKTNMDEFAMGTSTENSAFGTVHNPWDLDKVPGGSSGGSAATVAAGLVDFAIGTDTGGSSRQPAALCGVYGFKPTYGRISRYGIIPLGSSLDQAGIFSRDVATISKVLGVVAGLDPLDATSSAKPLELTSGDTKGLKVGLLRDDLAQEGLQSEVGEATLQAAEALRRQGAEIIEVALPALKFSIATYYVILPAEASSNLARYDGIHFNHASGRGKTLLDRYVETRSDLFGDEPKRRILIGTFSLSAGYQEAYYKKAQAMRALIASDYAKVFKQVDLLLGPTAPTTAFRIGEKQTPLELYLADIFTVSANLAGLPAISIPFGSDTLGMPIGVQLTAPAWQEARLLRVATALGPKRAKVAPR